MKTLLIPFFSILIGLSSTAYAGESSDIDPCMYLRGISDACDNGGGSGGGSNDVPEFNAGTATLGLGLVITIGAFIRERRRRK